MQPLPMWPVMLYHFAWAEHEQHLETLREVCHEQQKQNNVSNIAEAAKNNLYESRFDFFTLPDPSVQALGHWIKDCFFQAAAHANKGYWPAGSNIQVEVHESWCHITHNGGYHDMHIHPNSSWSCIYYLDTGDMQAGTKNGNNRFFNPHNSMYMDIGTAWNTANTSIDIQPQPGMLIVFPSWLPHSALTYYGEQERIVISANCRIDVADMSEIQLAI